jgi:hypothetical protein
MLILGKMLLKTFNLSRNQDTQQQDAALRHVLRAEQFQPDCAGSAGRSKAIAALPISAADRFATWTVRPKLL